MAKRSKKASWRTKRKGKTCVHGFRKHSAKCRKRARRSKRYPRAKKKKRGGRAKRKGKTCRYGFRKKSAKCLKHPRGKRSRRSSVRRQEASMWKKYRRGRN